MKPYDHKKIEKKWQKQWDSKKIYQVDTKKAPKPTGISKGKFYPLVEFPFPSGDGLHNGHLRSYTAMDIVARKRRMEGYDVLFPIGWDAFGLPTENYAIKTGQQPKVVTKKNTDNFMRQLKACGFSFDWSKLVDTTDPAYYKWTQWIFIQMFKKGLAYKSKMLINWCPKDKTGLANEEVIDGKCERCGTPVEKREKEQWMLAITKYADRLYGDLDGVDYLDRIKTQQRNWIGRSEGSEIDFYLNFKKNPKVNENRGSDGKAAHLPVFTTRPDTIFGVTYIVLSPDHPWVKLATDDKHDILENKEEIKKYIESVKGKTEIERTAAGKEKTGVEIRGVKAINPATKEEIPMFVADYVLAQYGTGAVMAVPAHDERDFEFAKKYKLPIKEVIEPLFTKTDGEDAFRKDMPISERRSVVGVIKHWSEDKYLGILWKKTDWHGFVIGGIEGNETAKETGLREIVEETGYKNVEYVKDLGGIVHGRFFSAIKKENRVAHFEPVLFKLKDGERAEVAEEEKALHELRWLTPAEIRKFINRPDMHVIWDRVVEEEKAMVKEGILKEPTKFKGREWSEALPEIIDWIVKKGYGRKKINFKLRDWIFSRQRYWGEPIPMIHCEKCGWNPVPDKDLPVKLPTVKKYEPTYNGESPLSAIASWVKVKCPQCKGSARRETDTMPNWAGSSWYYLRYMDPKNKKELAGKGILKNWLPVDWYNGGMEHTTLHLLYSRFWHKFLFDIGAVPTSEPYKKRTSQGMVLASDGEKMSKSRGNVVSPDTMITTYGADTLRLYEMFMGPFDQAIPWSTDNMIGSRRFVERLWNLQNKIDKKLTGTSDFIHPTIKKVGDDIERMGFNTAISCLMILLNSFEKAPAISREDYETFITLVAPFAPHVVEEIWNGLGNKKSIHLQPWPEFDPRRLVSNTLTIVVQINGKSRATFTSDTNDEEKVKAAAAKLPEIQKWTEGKTVSRIIYVRGKLVNIVVA